MGQGAPEEDNSADGSAEDKADREEGGETTGAPLSCNPLMGDGQVSPFLTCHRHRYNMPLTKMAGKARNEGGESEMCQRANHSAAFLQQTCGLGGIPFRA